MSNEHPVQQTVRSITVADDDNGSEVYTVGVLGTTRIEACTKSGMHSEIPYFRVWKGELASAEFCQHGIVGAYFDMVPAEMAAT